MLLIIFISGNSSYIERAVSFYLAFQKTGKQRQLQFVFGEHKQTK
jgi:hypothetical protein